MHPDLHEWLSLLVRWVHVIAGIYWIGATLYLTRMKRQMGKEGAVWTVHGGGVTVHQEEVVAPAHILDGLKWFKYESLTTWVSGALLLVLVYYLGTTLTVPESGTSEAAALAIAIGTVFGGAAIYHVVWRFIPPGRYEFLGALVGYAALVGVAHFLCSSLNGRAAYIHLGALFGTIMVSNVWLTILPAQRRMVAAMRAGKYHDQSASARAARCTQHNTYLMVPTVLAMISSHYPTATYGSDWNALIFAGLVLVGWGGAWLLRNKF